MVRKRGLALSRDGRPKAGKRAGQCVAPSKVLPCRVLAKRAIDQSLPVKLGNMDREHDATIHQSYLRCSRVSANVRDERSARFFQQLPLPSPAVERPGCSRCLCCSDLARSCHVTSPFLAPDWGHRSYMGFCGRFSISG